MNRTEYRKKLTENGCLAFFKLSAGDFAVNDTELESPGLDVVELDFKALLLPASASLGISKTIMCCGQVEISVPLRSS